MALDLENIDVISSEPTIYVIHFFLVVMKYIYYISLDRLGCIT